MNVAKLTEEQKSIEKLQKLTRKVTSGAGEKSKQAPEDIQKFSNL